MRIKTLVVCMLLGAATCAPAVAEISIDIGINLPVYPDLVQVPGYPVYYAPQLETNFFFYDGLYWVYAQDRWYASRWYNGPWDMVDNDMVPLYVLRVPVRYYRQPPQYFRGWSSETPPHWGDRWGGDWERQHSDWDHWNHASAPAPAPLPTYQRQYSRDRYPSANEQQQLHQQNYHYQPHEDVVRQRWYQQPATQAVPARQAAPEQHNAPRQAVPEQHNAPRQAVPEQRNAPPQAVPEQHNAPRQAVPEQRNAPRPPDSGQAADKHEPQPQSKSQPQPQQRQQSQGHGGTQPERGQRGAEDKGDNKGKEKDK
jgi:hypothetical protein